MKSQKYLLSAVLAITSTLVSAQEAPSPAAAVTAESVPAADVTKAAEQTVAAMPAVQAAEAPMTIELDPAVAAAIGKPEPGKALVVFFRPSAFVGSMIGFIVREQDVELGKLRNGNYFTVQSEPGKHEYVVHAEAKDVTTLELEEGETYFLSGELNFGVVTGRPNLSPSSITAFAGAFPKLKPSKPLKK